MKSELESLLLSQDTYVIDGVLNKNKLSELARKYDSQLLKLLIEKESIRNHFFSKVDDGIHVFKKDTFLQFINNKAFLPDSYTAYKTKIGLGTDNEKYILENNDVVLNFPYKDCILEGGQTKEDAKRQEVFFNKTLAPNKINRLLDNKVFTNFKRYDKDGEHELVSIEDTDNLIIKGNNLVVLHSLKKRYSGKVKCIYIDPPYYFDKVKNEDTFQYNSNFKLSTWLVFMKNRLQIAKDLLAEDGAIFIQISDDGVAELHILMKEIFGRDNFINKITVKTKSPSGFASVNPGLFETAEYILSFAKNKVKWKYNTQFVRAEYDSNYKFFVLNKDEDVANWKIVNLDEYIVEQNNFKSKKEAIKKLGTLFFHNLVSEFALNHADSIFRYTPINNNASKQLVELRDISRKTPDLVFYQKREDNYDVYVKNGQEIAFYSKKIRKIDGQLLPSIQLSNIWNDTPYEGIAKEGNVQLKGGKKPEKLIKRIIELSSNVGDLILDFHLGSGTTAAVAHKLNRKYIGVEQLNYEENDSIQRIKNVINGDSTGISKDVDWQGGGSFVYCELKNDAQDFLNKIEFSSTSEQLIELLEQVKKSSFLSYRVETKKLHREEFAKLSLFEQKQLLAELIDQNNLYVNFSDIDDANNEITEKEKELNRQFYKEV